MTSKSLDLGSTHLVNPFIWVWGPSLLKKEEASRNRDHSPRLTVIDREEHKSKYNSEGQWVQGKAEQGGAYNNREERWVWWNKTWNKRVNYCKRQDSGIFHILIILGGLMAPNCHRTTHTTALNVHSSVDELLRVMKRWRDIILFMMPTFLKAWPCVQLYV